MIEVVGHLSCTSPPVAYLIEKETSTSLKPARGTIPGLSA